MVVFGKNLGLSSVIVTIIVVGGTILLWNDAITNNTDYGVYTNAIRLLALCGVCVSAALLAGCYVQYQGWKKEELEALAPKQ